MCLKRILELIGIKVDIIVFYIKIMKQIFKFSPNSKIGFIVREAEYVVDRYNIFNEKTKHVKD
jgi:hypothetical protein